MASDLHERRFGVPRRIWRRRLRGEREGSMSRADKHRALRLFLYLRAVGRTPARRAAANYFELAAMLNKEYEELPHDVRRAGRLVGRQLIRAAGLKAAYQCSPNVEELRLNIIPRPKCPQCRVKRLNKPKSIWRTQEDAEAFCSCFSRYAPYPCPVGNGWHVAHRKHSKIPTTTEPCIPDIGLSTT
jgi:hypothetical protein